MKQDSPIRARVFLVGCPRSGTTLVQGVLAAHPMIHSFPETHFFAKAYPRNPVKRLLTWPALNVRGVLEKLVLEIGRPDLVDSCKMGLLEAHYHRAFVELLDRLTLEAGRSIWVEKTPRHLHFVDQIARRIPGSKFVHVVRNGLAVVASLHRATQNYPEAWGGKRSVERCIQRWNCDVTITASYAGRPNHMVIQYENLVSDPRTTAESIAGFLAIPFDPRMEHPERVAPQIVRAAEAWKRRNAERVEQIHRGTRQPFTDVERAAIQRRLLDAEALLRSNFRGGER